MSRRMTWRRGEYLFHEGDRGNGLHVIDCGFVAIRKVTRGGHESIFTVLGPGEVFGEQALLHAGARRTASAVALDDVTARVLGVEHFDTLRLVDPRFDRLLIDVLAAQVRRLSSQLIDAQHATADQRVLRRLIMLVPAYRVGPDEASRVELKLTQTELASMSGVSRQTVNELLIGLASEGLLDLSRGRILITDLDELERRSL